MTIYNDYSKARLGLFLGLRLPQLIIPAVLALAPLYSFTAGLWLQGVALLVIWVLVSVLLVVPMRGRSIPQWTIASLLFVVASVGGRAQFRARVAQAEPIDEATPDLPGVLSNIEIHEGEPVGMSQRRMALIQNHATKTWAITARIVHPGISLKDQADRDELGASLAHLIEVCVRGEMIDELLFVTRTVPDDGAERFSWLESHLRAGAPVLAKQVTADLHSGLAQRSFRTEHFVTVVVTERGRFAKDAKGMGGGIAGRGKVLELIAREVEGTLRGALQMSEVTWLTSPELATATRTGFAPGDRASIVDALGARERDPNVAADMPWALAGPSGADQVIRHYSHDAWNSASVAIQLPTKGALMGALAPVLTPSVTGERRSYVLAIPLVNQGAARRRIENRETAATAGNMLREKIQRRQSASERDNATRNRNLETKVARGSALIQPYAVATVTVPKTLRISEHTQRLDAAVRAAGFSPLRLDLAHDVAFASSCVPMGISLARGTKL